MDIDNFALGRVDLIRDVGNCRDHIHVELPEEALLDYLQMQEPEETAPETKAKGER